MELAGETVRAVSVGGMETCIALPRHKLGFDIGRCPPFAHALSRILFTHAHSDHMGGVVHHCTTRDLLGMKPPEYWVPAENEADFHALLEVWRRLDRSSLPCTVRPVRPGERHAIGQGRWVEVFRAPHRVPAVGYALGRERQKLKAELVGAPREEIIRRRQAGEPIHDTVDTTLVAFCGDTTIEVVDREPLVRTARLLLLEVTFLDDRVRVRDARRKGHVHLDEVIARADLFENEALLFTHVSARYSNAEMRRILGRRLPERLRGRAHVLPHEPPW